MDDYTTFNPWGEPRPCWHCHHFEALVYQNTSALCKSKTGPRVRSGPASGCSGWEREPSANDEPAPLSLLAIGGPLAPGLHQPVHWAP